MDTDEVVKATMSSLVVCKVGDDTWAGTRQWLVKERIPKQVEAEMIASLITASFDVPLTRACYREYAPILMGNGFGYDGLLRIYERPDGKRVHVPDAHLKAIETMCESEDEEGYSVPFDYELRQRGGFHGPIGVFEKGVDLAAFVMPQRLINDHLLDHTLEEFEALHRKASDA